MYLFARYLLKNGEKTFARGEVIPGGTFDDRTVERLVTTNQAYMESKPLRAREDLKAIAEMNGVGHTGSAQVLTDRLIIEGIDPWQAVLPAEEKEDA
jgi:hypothetical protein